MIPGAWNLMSERSVFSPSSGAETHSQSQSLKQGIEHWKKFYADHKTYWKVGRLMLPPIDPKSPIPEHCDPAKRAKQEEQRKKDAERQQRQKAKQEAEARHGEEL
jgi:hypothetical protein